VRISLDAVVALIGCLIVAIIPLPRRAEGLRIGAFGGVLAFLAYDAMKRTTDEDLAAIPAPSAQPGLMAIPVRPVADEDRLSAIDLLTDFSVLRHLRRAGAVDDREYELKKADILRRV
jgi:hypothetical protein